MGGHYRRRAECLIKQGKIKAKETNEEAEYENLSGVNTRDRVLASGKNFTGDDHYRSLMKQNNIGCLIAEHGGNALRNSH